MNRIRQTENTIVAGRIDSTRQLAEFNLIGYTGPTGPTGPTGITGPTGATGSAAGTPYFEIHSSSDSIGLSTGVKSTLTANYRIINNSK
jgi:hypothetical protein